MTEIIVDAARRLCYGRLVAEHEVGYSAELVPFCGPVIVEALSGVGTDCAARSCTSSPPTWANTSSNPTRRR